MSDIAHSPLVESEREALRQYAGETNWAIGVLIESALWNLECAETQLEELREAARAVVEAWQRGHGERAAVGRLSAALDAFGGQ